MFSRRYIPEFMLYIQDDYSRHVVGNVVHAADDLRP